MASKPVPSKLEQEVKTYPQQPTVTMSLNSYCQLLRASNFRELRCGCYAHLCECLHTGPRDLCDNSACPLRGLVNWLAVSTWDL
eukprot:jgi/Botrbrau1/11460/Bobra.27_4s0001.1